MSVTLPTLGTSPTPSHHSVTCDKDVIDNYFIKFEELSKSEKWQDIITQGTAALNVAKLASRAEDEAKICAQLASSAYYLGDYPSTLDYAKRSRELSKDFENPTLFIRAHYLESAAYRGLAGKNNHEQSLYQNAITIAEKALEVFANRSVVNENLKGKVYFNLGAAHADNPNGNLEKAADCYVKALESYKNVNATDDINRTSIRLGKVYLLQKNYDLSQNVINEVRQQQLSERIAMHVDYLEAQLKVALNDSQAALQIANRGLVRAQNLKASVDESRLTALIADINKTSTS